MCQYYLCRMATSMLLKLMTIKVNGDQVLPHGYFQRQSTFKDLELDRVLKMPMIAQGSKNQKADLRPIKFRPFHLCIHSILNFPVTMLPAAKSESRARQLDLMLKVSMGVGFNDHGSGSLG